MKIIAFYLPQFHSFPENDKWWGTGFTEWTNTKKSRPHYKGHYMPREPLNDNYYCLLDKSTFEWQINLAKEYGIYGFCFYHYWFGEDTILMKKPMELYLNNQDLDLPFCISWANETWSRRWNGSDQDNGTQETWIRHFEYLLDFFKDKRYIKVDGKPLFVLYKPEIFPDYKEMFKLWDTLAKKNGLPGITFAVQGAVWNNILDVDDSFVDYRIMYEPGYTACQSKDKKGLRFRISTRILKELTKMSSGIKVNCLKPYGETCLNIVNRKVDSDKMIPGFFVNWDNTPRKGDAADSYIGSNPKVYEKYLSLLIKKAREEYKKDIIFINAWNEWAESCYLEPDKKFGYGYLEATKRALIVNSEFPSFEDLQND